jgi:pimeloyl-ACP methyl ester carboxylesterase
MASTPLSRRRFMQLAGTGSAGAVLAATHHAQGTAAAGPETVRPRAAVEMGSISRIQVEPIGAYDVDRLNEILTEELAEFSTFEISYPPARYGVTLYRVTYPSVIPEKNNRPTIASGLIAIPDGVAGTRPVVSYQHGSVFGKNEVPSSPEQSMETRLMIANFAGQGYVVIGADYFGKGISTERNSYLVKPSTQQACLDMLFAVEAASADLGVGMGQLFLSGWSQGGWSALVFLNRLEDIGIPVTAAAVASGPPDMFAMLNRWANNWQPIDAAYIPPLVSILLNAMEEYYGMPGFVNAAIKPEYQQATRDLYLNIRTIEQVEPLIPTRLPDLLQDDFKAALGRGDDRFGQLLHESHGYRWRAVTPMHLYHGGIDEVTPAYIGQLPVGYQQIIGGAAVTAVDAGPKADHRGTFLFGMKDQQEWFGGLLK